MTNLRVKTLVLSDQNRRYTELHRIPSKWNGIRNALFKSNGYLQLSTAYSSSEEDDSLSLPRNWKIVLSSSLSSFPPVT